MIRPAFLGAMNSWGCLWRVFQHEWMVSLTMTSLLNLQVSSITTVCKQVSINPQLNRTILCSYDFNLGRAWLSNFWLDVTSVWSWLAYGHLKLWLDWTSNMDGVILSLAGLSRWPLQYGCLPGTKFITEMSPNSYKQVDACMTFHS